MKLDSFTRRTFLGMSLVALAGCAGMGRGKADAGKLYIIHINDVHGFIAPSDTAIGYAKIAGFIENFKKQHPNTLVLDTGDNFVGSSYAAYKNADGVLQILNTVGFDAMAAGNADFVLGGKGVLEKAAAASFPIISANIVGADGKALLKPSVILTTEGGIKVGVIGLTPPASRGTSAKVNNIDIVAAAQAEIDKLKPQVDVIIALAHLGDNDMDKDTSLRLARETHGLDLIVDGHSHTVLPEGRRENGLLIVQAGEFSKYLGLVEMDLVANRPVNARARLYDKQSFEGGPEKAATAAVLASVLAESDEYFSHVVGSTSVFLDAKREHVRTGETACGNFMADAVREAGQAEVGLMMAAAMGGEFQPGNITRGDFLTLMRVNGAISLVDAKGEDIQLCLEDSVRNWPQASGYFPQVSGLSFDLHSTAPKVRNLKIGGKPVQADRVYRVAAIRSYAQGKGLSNGKTIKANLMDFEEVLLTYFKKHSPIAPQIEGRINAKA